MPNIRLVAVMTLLLISSVTLIGAGDMRLAEAAKANEGARLRALIKSGVDVNVPLSDGSTALHWAVYWDDQDAADLLISARANVNVRNDLGVTPLWIAATNSSEPMVLRLLKAGADPNIAATRGGTPLMRAVLTGSASLTKLLLDNGADVNAREPERGQTALMLAVAQHHANVVKLLLEAHADVTARSKVRPRLVYICCQAYNGDARGDMVEIDEGSLTALLLAARDGDIDATQLLLSAGASVDDTTPWGATALVVAAYYGHGDVAALLLGKGAAPNHSDAGFTALHAAVLRGDVGLVKALIDQGAEVDAHLTRGSPARRSGQDYAFSKNWIGATPFWLAAAFHRTEIMKVLASAGANPGFTLGDGTTALIVAVRGETPRALAQGGQFPSAFGADEEQLALQAAQVVVQVASSNSSLNASDQLGDTALHYAASKRFNSVVEFLVRSGAAVDRKNQAGQTPLAMALMGHQLPKDGTFCAGAGDKYLAAMLPGPSSTSDLLKKLGAKE
jgi:ankyrin repeat protein